MLRGATQTDLLSIREKTEGWENPTAFIGNQPGGFKVSGARGAVCLSGCMCTRGAWFASPPAKLVIDLFVSHAAIQAPMEALNPIQVVTVSRTHTHAHTHTGFFLSRGDEMC